MCKFIVLVPFTHLLPSFSPMQLLFLGFFPEPPFLFFFGFVVCHIVSSNLNFFENPDWQAENDNQRKK